MLGIITGLKSYAEYHSCLKDKHFPKQVCYRLKLKSTQKCISINVLKSKSYEYPQEHYWRKKGRKKKEGMQKG